MDKVKYIKNDKRIFTKRDEIWGLFRGLVACLEPEEACDAFDINFSQGRTKRFLIQERIIDDVKAKPLEKHLSLFRKLLTIFNKLGSYSKTIACSSVLCEMCPFMPKSEQKQTIKILLKSNYVHVRNRAYKLLKVRWDNCYSDLAVKAWKIFQDPEIMSILIYNLSEKDLYGIFYSLEQYFQDEEYDGKLEFPLLIMRNHLYVRVSRNIQGIIDKLKSEDPVSYIYVMKESKQKIDSEYALKVYHDDLSCRSYLPLWLGQIKMWNVLVKIDEMLTKGE